MNPPFHLAFLVRDLDQTKHFYRDVLGCPEGRSTDAWADFNFFGHQISAHLSTTVKAADHFTKVDEKDVPVPHFGAVLEPSRFDELAQRLTAEGIKFVIEPTTRFKGQVGEQKTMFLMDPSGNALEFKSFQDASQIYAT